MRRFAALCLLVSSCSRPEPVASFRMRIGVAGTLGPLAPDLDSGYGMLINGLVFQPLMTPSRTSARASRVFDGLQFDTPRRLRFRPRAGLSFSDGSAVERADLEAAFGDRGSLRESSQGFTLDWTSQEDSPAVHLLRTALWKRSPSGDIGTGPYVVVAQSEEHILLRARRPRLARVNEVELVSFPNPRDAFAALLRREVNVFLMPDDGQLELLSGIRALKLIRGQGLQSVAVVFNVLRVDRKTRRGLAESARVGGAALAYGPPCRPQESTSTAEGLGSGAPLKTLVVNMNHGFVRAALAVRRGLGARGGATVSETPRVAVERALEGDFDLMVTPVQTWPVELAASMWLSNATSNFGRYVNPGVEEAMSRSDYVTAQRELDADPPALFLCDLDRTAAVDSRLVDARLGDYDMLDSVEDWTVAP